MERERRERQRDVEQLEPMQGEGWMERVERERRERPSPVVQQAVKPPLAHMRERGGGRTLLDGLAGDHR